VVSTRWSNIKQFTRVSRTNGRRSKQSDGSLGVHTQHKLAVFTVENVFNKVEVRKTSYGHQQCDVALTQFKHCSMLNATTQQTLTSDRPCLSAAVVTVVPDDKPLQHNAPCKPASFQTAIKRTSGRLYPTNYQHQSW